MEPESRAEGWKEYFEKLPNGKMPTQSAVYTEYGRAESHVDDIS